jgi:Putative zinc dependent peptidase (DUF5700)
MFEPTPTLALLDAIENKSSNVDLEALLQGPELSLMFPAVGISNARGVEYLADFRDGKLPPEQDPAASVVASYLADLLDRADEFREIAEVLRTAGPSLYEAALDQTLEYLPPHFEMGNPRIIFLPIGYDFRADRESVYLDPLTALMVGKLGVRDGLIHELHHVGRYRLTCENLSLMRPDPRGPPTDPLTALRRWVSWLELEGVADCAWSMTRSEAPLYQSARVERLRQFDEYDRIIRDAMLPIAGPNQTSAANAPAQFFDGLRELAHPVGHRIASEILNDAGRPGLVECVGHPALFLSRYNEIASRKGLVTFPSELQAALAT